MRPGARRADIAVARGIYFDQRRERFDPERNYLGLEAQHSFEDLLHIAVSHSRRVRLTAESFGRSPSFGDVLFDHAVGQFDTFSQWPAGFSFTRRVGRSRLDRISAPVR